VFLWFKVQITVPLLTSDWYEIESILPVTSYEFPTTVHRFDNRSSKVLVSCLGVLLFIHWQYETFSHIVRTQSLYKKLIVSCFPNAYQSALKSYCNRADHKKIEF